MNPECPLSQTLPRPAQDSAARKFRCQTATASFANFGVSPIFRPANFWVDLMGLAGRVFSKVMRTLRPDATGGIPEPASTPPRWSVIEYCPGVWKSYPPFVVPSGPITPVPVTDDTLEPGEITAGFKSEVSRAFILAYAFVIATAARKASDLSIFDFGGSLGGYYRVARNAVPDCKIDYTIQELEEVCAVGRVARPDVRFVSDSKNLAKKYDLVVASSALQYVEDWKGKLTELALLADPWIYIARPMIFSGVTRLLWQNLPDGDDHVTVWAFGREDFLLAATEAGLSLVYEFDFQDDFEEIGGLQERPTVKGYLFRRTDAG